MTNEVRSVSSTGGEKGTKDERFDLLPWGSLAKIARHFGEGAKKYDDHNWRRGYEWSKSFAALQRHLTAFWEGEDIDEETGSPHLAAAGFHILVLLEYMDTHPDFDDRYKKPETNPLGEVFTDELPEVDGFYADNEGTIWELRTALTMSTGRWTIAKDDISVFLFEDRWGDWTDAELARWLPFTRVEDPEVTRG